MGCYGRDESEKVAAKQAVDAVDEVRSPMINSKDGATTMPQSHVKALGVSRTTVLILSGADKLLIFHPPPPLLPLSHGKEPS